MSSTGRFVWFDHLARDVEAARDFYTHVVGWGTQEWRGGAEPYAMWTAGGVPVGGLMKIPAEMEQAGTPPHWFGHVTVEDVDASAARAEELGGRVLSPPADIPEVGRYAIVADPTGATVSLFAPLGGGMAPDTGKPGFVGWHELHTTDHREAWRFYSALLGWEHSTTMDMGEMGSYFVFRHPGDAADSMLGAMFDASKWTGRPPHWLYYVNVDDLDAAVARVRERGGQVQHGPTDVPGGRMAQCLDPQGGPFALHSANQP
jgi:hypothetical protein